MHIKKLNHCTIISVRTVQIFLELYLSAATSILLAKWKVLSLVLFHFFGFNFIPIGLLDVGYTKI